MGFFDRIITSIRTSPSSDEPAPLDRQDEELRSLGADLASAHAIETRARDALSQSSSDLRDARRVADNAQAELDRLVEAGADDDAIVAARTSSDIATMRLAPFERRKASAEEILADASAAVARLEHAGAEREAERAHAELVESASLDGLYADNAEDVAYVLDAVPNVIAALDRMGRRFDERNRCAEQVSLTRLDIVHAFGGILRMLADRDAAHARRFLSHPQRFRHACEEAAYGRPTRIPIALILDLLSPPDATAYPTDQEDLERVLSCRTSHEAADAQHEVDRDRARVEAERKANDPEEIARQQAWRDEQERLADEPRYAKPSWRS